jgi:cytochrome c2
VSRRQWTLVGVAIALAALVVALAVRNPQPPLMPVDAEHAGDFVVERCMTCHAAGAPVPQSANHPLGQDCLRCHGFRRAAPR